MLNAKAAVADEDTRVRDEREPQRSRLRREHRNAYVLQEDDARLQPAPERAGAPPPVVDLDPRFYTALADSEARFSAGLPSLVRAERLVVRGHMTFRAGTVVSGVGEA